MRIVSALWYYKIFLFPKQIKSNLLSAIFVTRCRCSSLHAHLYLSTPSPTAKTPHRHSDTVTQYVPFKTWLDKLGSCSWNGICFSARRGKVRSPCYREGNLRVSPEERLLQRMHGWAAKGQAENSYWKGAGNASTQQECYWSMPVLWQKHPPGRRQGEEESENGDHTCLQKLQSFCGYQPVGFLQRWWLQLPDHRMWCFLFHR